VLAFRVGLARSPVGLSLGPHLTPAFASFALLLAPLWFFGFGAGEWLRNSVQSRVLRIFLPVLLGVPYLVFAVPTGNFHWQFATTIFVLPLALAAFLELPALPPRLFWQDAVVLGALVATYMLRGLAGAWPYPGLAALPKLYVADLALYLYIVVRKLEGIGYSFIPTRAACLIGLREWVYFLPFGIGLGAALSFIHFHPRLPSGTGAAAGVLVTFLLVAIPEEMFFRGILQNLLQTRWKPWIALAVASVLFGLSHFNKGASFNWRYVLLAAIAGIFYGRAWRARRQLLASVITHTAVDVVWSLWFR
jgi:membrane protease YdiL (CAAX protease family)